MGCNGPVRNESMMKWYITADMKSSEAMIFVTLLTKWWSILPISTIMDLALFLR